MWTLQSYKDFISDINELESTIFKSNLLRCNLHLRKCLYLFTASQVVLVVKNLPPNADM